MARNCERSAVTSAAVKPAERRRSKPRGAGVVCGGGWTCPDGNRGERSLVSVEGRAFCFFCWRRIVDETLASLARSVSESAMSPIEQWIYRRGRVSCTACLPFPLSWDSDSVGRGLGDGEGGSFSETDKAAVSSRPRPA